MLSWAQVNDMVAVADFDILRDARQDIRALAWTDPIRRRAAGLHHNIKHAHEEIFRLNVEVRRRLTQMVDDHVDHYRAIERAVVTDPHLAHELSQRLQYLKSIHEDMASRLHKLRRLPGFSGVLESGRRIGRDPSLSIGVPLPAWAQAVRTELPSQDLDEDSEAEGEDDLEDDEHGDHSRNGYVAGISNPDAASEFLDLVQNSE